MPHDFRVLKKAQLSSAQFGAMIGVTRMAVYNWREGRTSPHPMVERKVNRALKLVVRLVERGSLPVAPHLDKDHRREKLQTIIHAVQQRV